MNDEGAASVVIQRMKGIAASSGIVIAKAYPLEKEEFSIKRGKVQNTEEEIKRFEAALEASKKEILEIREQTRKQLGDEDAEIFTAHLLLLEDPELIDQVKKRVILESINVEVALSELQAMVMNIFKNMDNFYMRERGADFKDVMNRIMAHLAGDKKDDSLDVQEEVIIVAEDLLPSDTAKLNRKFIKGFITSMGGITSHSAIIARSLEIPAVTGIERAHEKVTKNDLLIVDGNEGKVIINPPKEVLKKYRQKKQEHQRKKKLWLQLKDHPTITEDKQKIELVANISTPDEVEIIKHNGAQGIGLYRTEYLYMDQTHLPTEDEQFKIYKSVLSRMNGLSVCIRTLDIGGDKEIHYLNFPEELNPFLGVRGIRFSLNNEEIFRSQLRALLRASAYGHLKIMFPMISTLEELHEAKGILKEEKEDLINKGSQVSENIEIGIMVETPSAAILADAFAKEVDFFSIGTNDLTQYTMAADRMNEDLSHLHVPYHPAILHLINHVIEAAHREGKSVGMCGEMAGDEKSIPILIALGIDQLSMSASSILPIRAQLKNLNQRMLSSYKDDILAKITATEVIEFIDHIM